MSTPETNDFEAALLIAQALADPQRYAIVRFLAKYADGVQCSTLLDLTEVAAPTLSHHMRELREAGLVMEHRTGRTVRYVLRRDIVEAFLNTLERDVLGA